MVKNYELDGDKFFLSKSGWVDSSYLIPAVLIKTKLDHKYSCEIDELLENNFFTLEVHIEYKRQKGASMFELLQLENNRYYKPVSIATATNTINGTYLNRCWNCKTGIDSSINVRCDYCNLFICAHCGRCMCK